MNKPRKQKRAAQSRCALIGGSPAGKPAVNRRTTGWRELDEAFESARKLLNQIKRDHPKLYKKALRRHRQEQENK